MQHDESFAPSELLYLFLDGETDDIQQSMLFSAMAHSSELQEEFRDALQMYTAGERLRNDLTTPEAASKAVFGRLGIGGSDSPDPINSATAARATPHWQLWYVPIATAAAGALITALFMMPGALGSSADSPAALVEEPAAVSAPPAKIALGESGTARGEATNTDLARNDGDMAEALTAVKEEASASSLTSDDRPDLTQLITAVPNSAGIDEPASALFTPQPFNLSQARGLRLANVHSPDLYQSGGIQPLPPTPVGSLEVAAGTADDKSWLPHSVQLAGVDNMLYFPDRSIAGGEATTLNNASLALLYDLNDEIAFGIELGQTTLPLRVLNGDRYEDVPVLRWAGGLLLYRPAAFELAFNLRPFMQSTLAATRSGPMLRSVVGLEYTPETRVSFALGVEGTGLAYQHEGSIFVTSKFGFNYRVGIRF